MKPLEKILLVEDALDVQLVAKMSLEKLGHFLVEICSSGLEALEKAPVYNPDILLLDVMMPGLDGPTTLLELRKIPSISKTPAVFMTAKVQPSDVEFYYQLGAIHVIPKPFDPIQLPVILSQVWEKHFKVQ